MIDNELEALERRTFREVTDDGLWDVWIAAFCAMFALAPVLSETLGDFWSVAIFLPIWAAAYLAIRLVRRRVVVPRIGTVRFGAARRAQLRRFSVVMLAVNLLAAVIGAVAFIGVEMDWLDPGDGGIAYPLGLGLVVLVGFSGAAHVTSILRYYLYGLMLAAAPLAGEWLWRHDLASHHGYPIVFGIAAVAILIGGAARFASVLRSHPLPEHPATV